MAHDDIKRKDVPIETTFCKEIADLRKKERQKRWEEGAKDPALLKDIADVETAFRYADAETARQLY